MPGSDDTRLFLRASLKLLTAFAAVFLAYILLQVVMGPGKQAPRYDEEIDVSSLKLNQSLHYPVQGRELLVIRSPHGYHAFWAQHPTYGCRLEYREPWIIPVCINLKYSLDGRSFKHDDSLAAPRHEMAGEGKLIIYSD